MNLKKFNLPEMNISPKISFLFLGTPEFGALIFEKIIKSKKLKKINLFPLAAITEPDKPKGRGKKLTPPPVKIIAEQFKIPVYQPQTKSELSSLILKLKPDLIIVAAYGKILPKEVLEIPKYKAINVHPSLLPKYRGPSPIQSAILNGDKETGVTIMLISEEMDAGDILAQEKIKIKKQNWKELSKELAELGGNLLIETIPKYLCGIEKFNWCKTIIPIKAHPQDHSKASYTKLIKKEDGHINWSKSAFEIERMIRAYFPWPGTFTKIKSSSSKLNGKILKIHKAHLPKKSPSLASKPPGTVFQIKKNEIAVSCGNKSILILDEVQLEGKKKMEIDDFLNGYPEILESLLT